MYKQRCMHALRNIKALIPLLEHVPFSPHNENTHSTDKQAITWRMNAECAECAECSQYHSSYKATGNSVCLDL